MLERSRLSHRGRLRYCLAHLQLPNGSRRPIVHAAEAALARDFGFFAPAVYPSGGTELDTMERCPVCGQTYMTTHDCPGAAAPVAAPTSKWIPPAGVAIGYYLKQAFAIACFDRPAIRAAAGDEKSIPYGAVIWTIGQLFLFANRLLPAARSAHMGWFAIANSALTIVILDAGWALTQYALCHAVGRWLFGARGTYIGIVRAIFLGSITMWLAVIPYAGLFMGAIWFLAVLMRVFEEVDGIAKMQAFGLALGTSLLFGILTLGLLGMRP
jgi:hypothetical protein